MSGKLIILEGTDASGKSTQFALLRDRLTAEGRDFKTVAFPRYKEESSSLIRMYLNGDFGTDPKSVNAYAASTFFAVDRCASYLGDWKEYYENGGLMLLDRYTTSNAIHQSAKLPESERAEFCRWLFDFEYRLLGLPSPDRVLFMDMPPHFAKELLAVRRDKSRDIHERDLVYLSECYKTANMAAEMFAWNRISCIKDDKIRKIEDIHEEIYSAVNAVISKI